MASGNGFEVAKGYVTIIPSLEGSQASITSALTGITQSASEEAGESGGSSFSSKFADAIKVSSAVIASAVTVATTAAVAAGTEFINLAKDTASYADEVDKSSQKLQVSTDFYQEMDYALSLAGSSMSEMTIGFRNMTSEIANATSGNADALASFEALGISLEDLQTLSTEEIFTKAITSLQDMEEGTERASLASDIFGAKVSQNLAPLLNMSSEEMQEAIDTANEYGMVLSEDAVKAGADFTDAMTTLDNTVTGLKNNLMSQFLPALTETTEGLADVFAGGDTAKFEQGINDLIGDLKTALPQVLTILTTLGTSLIEGIGAVLPDLVACIFTLLNEALLTVTGMIPQLLPVITAGLEGILDSLLTSLPIITSSLLTLIVDIVSWLASGDNINRFVQGIIELVSVIASQISVVLPVLLPAIVKLVTAVASALTDADNIGLLVSAVLEIAVAIFVALVECVPELINFVITVIQNLADIIADGLDIIVPIISSGFNSAYTTIRSWLDQAKTFISSWISGIRSSFDSWLNGLKTSFSTAFNNIKTNISNIINKAKELVSNIITTISELPSKVVSIGSNLIESLWNSINNKVSWIKNKIYGMGSQIISAIKGVFGIASPSKVMMSVGGFLAEGLGIGFEDEMSGVQDDIVDSMNGLTGNMTADVSAYANTNAGLLGNTTNYNGGSITMNIYGAEGQNVEDLADTIAYKLEEMTKRRGAVYA